MEKGDSTDAMCDRAFWIIMYCFLILIIFLSALYAYKSLRRVAYRAFTYKENIMKKEIGKHVTMWSCHRWNLGPFFAKGHNFMNWYSLNLYEFETMAAR